MILGDRFCRECNAVIQDDFCYNCGSYVSDSEIITLKGEDYEYEEIDNITYKVTKDDKSYTCKLKVAKPASTKDISCTCIGYKYRSKCKHVEGLFSLLKSQPGLTVRIKKRHSRADVKQLIHKLDKGLLKSINYVVAGSYRRGKSDSKDLDIIVIGAKFDILLKRLKKEYPDGNKPRQGDKQTLFSLVSAAKSKKAILRWYVPIKEDEIILDFHFTNRIEFEPLLLYFTGSKEFNLDMRSQAKKMGMALNRYGLWKRDTKELITRKEKEIFKALRRSYVEPKSRG